ncbi:hypothetical protein [Nitrososphaera viennensis]|uniref:Uncharacterized protein n=2 Tax=Nitrososphaera viennensis TaxID=1034015 RepID=A0A060HQ40_9ARCH|nr:hypothetical protein [Nitrososphaera viennensis]AIC15302.1 hypothetical protein NVIE_010750 [Nitrososphaera viennensis EN76]UVS70204.1 hypothetical protein NWT39_05305 [Nitrososphaera viennensis]
MVQRRILKNQRRVGEAVMIVSGVGVGILGLALSVPQISFGGLCIIGLGIFSIFWR